MYRTLRRGRTGLDTGILLIEWAGWTPADDRPARWKAALSALKAGYSKGNDAGKRGKRRYNAGQPLDAASCLVFMFSIWRTVF